MMDEKEFESTGGDGTQASENLIRSTKQIKSSSLTSRLLK